MRKMLNEHHAHQFLSMLLVMDLSIPLIFILSRSKTKVLNVNRTVEHLDLDEHLDGGLQSKVLNLLEFINNMLISTMCFEQLVRAIRPVVQFAVGVRAHRNMLNSACVSLVAHLAALTIYDRRGVRCALGGRADLLHLAPLLSLLPVIRRDWSKEKDMRKALGTAVASPKRIVTGGPHAPTRDRSAVRRRSMSRASFDVNACARVIRTTSRCPSAISSPSRAAMRRRITCTSETRVVHDHAALRTGWCGNG